MTHAPELGVGLLMLNYPFLPGLRRHVLESSACVALVSIRFHTKDRWTSATHAGG